MKKFYLISSITAISAVLCADAMAAAPTDISETDGVITISDGANNFTTYTSGQADTLLGGKQDTLTAEQLSAVNSGITSTLVTQIGINQTAIAGKQDTLTSEQLAAANSGITSTLVGQIGTNQSAIATLNGTGDGSVSKSISDAIDALDLANTYEAKGAATTAQNAIETKLGAGASGYDIDAKSLKVQGSNVATESYVNTATTVTAAATSSAGYAANTGATTAITALDGALKTAEDHIGNMTFTGTTAGSATTLTGAVNALDAKIGGAVTSTNYIADSNTINANLSALDARAKTNANNIGNMTFSGPNASSEITLTGAVNALDTAVGNRTYANNVGVNYGVIAANTNLTNAVSQVASNIGTAVSGAKGNVLATNTVNQNLDRLDSNIGNLSSITHTAFGGTNTDITSAMNALATNVANATGGTYAADGSWSATIVNTGAVKYQNNVSATNLMGAVNQVASNIGSWVTSTNNIGITNTVNQNITLLDTAIGDRTYTNEYNIADGESVTASLEKLDTAIGNRTITSANTAINNAVATDMATAFNTTGNLIGDMDFSGTRYLSTAASLSDAVRSLDDNLHQVEHKLNKTEYNLKSGLAAMSALSALVPNARDCGNTQVSVGTGVYADRVGIALGGFHYFNDHVLFNAGASYGGTKDWAFRAGVTFGLGL